MVETERNKKRTLTEIQGASSSLTLIVSGTPFTVNEPMAFVSEGVASTPSQ